MCRLLLCLALASISGSAVYAQQQPGPDKADDQQPTTWRPGQSRSIELFPAGDIFPVYAADPHRPTNQVAVGFYANTAIPATRSPRTTLSGGGRFGILKIESGDPQGRSWQVSLDAGFDGMFDSQYSNDAVGWDGNYGLTVTTTKRSSRVAVKLALLHVSAHLGDEYEERTRAARLNYTREEVAVAVAWMPRSRTRVYAELGVAYLMRMENQHRLRWQTGGEYERPPTVFGGRMAWYGAVDVSMLAERDWRLDTSFQGGLVTRTNGRTYRIYSQWYDGRSTLGQFTAYSEAALSLGFKVDL